MHSISLAERFAEQPVASATPGPAAYAPSRVQSRVQRGFGIADGQFRARPAERPPALAIGPGTYDPKLIVSHSAGKAEFNRANRLGEAPQPGYAQNADYKPNPVAAPGQPGHCGGVFPRQERDTLVYAERLHRIQQGPGSYNPRPANTWGSTPMAVMVGRPSATCRGPEGTGPSIGPGIYNISETAMSTVPAGVSAPAFSFSRRMYTTPAVEPAQKEAILQRSRTAAELHRRRLTPDGLREQAEERQQQRTLRESRSAGALVRRAQVEEARQSRLEAALAHRKERVYLPGGTPQQCDWARCAVLALATLAMGARLEEQRAVRREQRASELIRMQWRRRVRILTMRKEQIRLSLIKISFAVTAYAAQRRERAAAEAAAVLRAYLVDAQRVGSMVRAVRGYTYRVRRLQLLVRRRYLLRAVTLRHYLERWDVLEPERIEALGGAVGTPSKGKPEGGSPPGKRKGKGLKKAKTKGNLGR